MPNFFHACTAAAQLRKSPGWVDGAAQTGDLPGRAVGQQPFAVGILAEAILDQQLLGHIRRVLVPAIAEELACSAGSSGTS
jgi:hypothetical protein